MTKCISNPNNVSMLVHCPNKWQHPTIEGWSLVVQHIFEMFTNKESSSTTDHHHHQVQHTGTTCRDAVWTLVDVSTKWFHQHVCKHKWCLAVVPEDGTWLYTTVCGHQGSLDSYWWYQNNYILGKLCLSVSFASYLDRPIMLLEAGISMPVIG